MKVAVTGGTGFVGSHLVDALLERGHEVSCLARDPDRLRWLAGLRGVRIVFGDLRSARGLESLVEGQDLVVHAAARVKAPTQEAYNQVNVQGTVNVLHALEECRARPAGLIYISSQAAVGPCRAGRPRPVAEDADLRPVSRYGTSKALAEAALRKLGSGLGLTIVRPPVVYGPRDTDVLSYFRLVSRGLAPVIGHNVLSFVYVRNLVDGILLALERPSPGTRAYTFTDGGPCEWSQFAAAIAYSLGRRVYTLRVAPEILDVATAISGALGAITGRAQINDKLRDMRQRHWLLSDEAARRDLGYRPRYTMQQAVAETASWYLKERWVR